MGYQNIKHIADYEIKNITREWGFRFVVTFLTSLITWIHLNTQSNLFHPESYGLLSTHPRHFLGRELDHTQQNR